MQKVQSETFFFTLTDNKFNQLIKKTGVLMKSRVNIAVRVSSSWAEYTVKLIYLHDAITLVSRLQALLV